MAQGLHIVKKLGRLDDLLPSVVDESMRQIFRDVGVKVICDFLANNSRLRWEEIAEKPEVFSAGLDRLLGSGRSVIENLILKNLHRELGMKFEAKQGYQFQDYIKELRAHGDW